MSRVAVVKYGVDDHKNFLNRDQYKLLLESGLRLLSGGNGYETDLKRLFHKGVVGIKTNCLTRFNPTMKPLTDALAEKLLKHTGLEENNIVIWERTNRELKNAGYDLNAASFGRRCLGTDTNGIGFDDPFYSFGKVNSLVTRILTRIVDHNINLGVLKDHSIAGMSAGLKNMYGAVNNPNKYHSNNCDPFTAELNNLEPIRSKHRLTIVDAARVQYDKGPGFNADYLYYYNGIIMSNDPVAADRVALEILEHIRRKNGRPTLANAGRRVKYIETAEKIGLGVGDLQKIDLQIADVDDKGGESPGELF